MKKRILYFLLISMLTFFMGCSISKLKENKIRNHLIREIIAVGDKTGRNLSGKVIIFKSGYCATNDCEQYFKGFEEEIIVYAKEDLFMRNITNYLEIESINEIAKTATVIKYINRTAKTINIKL